MPSDDAPDSQITTIVTPAFQFRPELSEKSFRRWETEIAQAVSLYPSPLIWFPRPPRPTAVTCVSRIRDALLSFYRFRWSPTKIDTLKWTTIRDELRVRLDSEHSVYLGPKERVSLAAPATPTVLHIDLSVPRTAEVTSDILRCLCVCRELEVLPTLEIYGLRPEFLPTLDTIARDYSVAIMNTNGKITLV